ncbi:hypothetical protein [Flagellimonas algicola]|uniref:Uncharacterized protein n=1 Tax=Flagellimonas algicola TaxID=2583815 RepID=A0ABY2WQU5_9FLAO|nr:hypothetical protein [Allomuricauda algicola]TMU56904.1 hypothetical protein FGG15_04990 [Allomuricauda algicola]
MNKILVVWMVLALGLGGVQTTKAQRFKKLKSKVEKKVERKANDVIDGKPGTTKRKSNNIKPGTPTVSSAGSTPTSTQETTATPNQEPNTTKTKTTMAQADENCKRALGARSRFETEMTDVQRCIEEECGSEKMRGYLSKAEYYLEQAKQKAPDCDTSDMEKAVSDAKQILNEYEKEFVPFNEGTYSTSSFVYPKIEVGNFKAQMGKYYMDVNLFKKGATEPEVVTVSYSSSETKPEKFEGRIQFNTELKFNIYEKEDHHVLEIYQSNDFASVILFGEQDAETLKKKVQEFRIPDSKSEGEYAAMGDMQKREAGRIVVSNSDNLGHDNHGPFSLKELEIGKPAHMRSFHQNIEPPMETLQRAGIHITQEGYGIRILTEYHLNGKLVAKVEDGPLYDDARLKAHTWTSIRHPLWKNEREGYGIPFIEEHVLKENLPVGDYPLEIKKYVFSVEDNQEDYKILLATSGPLTLKVTEAGYRRLCNSEYGPSKAPKDQSAKAKTLLSVLRKHAKAQGWTETFINDVRNVTKWTPVRNVFGVITHYKCSATFRAKYPLADGRYSFGEINSLLHRKEGRIEVFGMSGQHYIPNCNKGTNQ